MGVDSGGAVAEVRVGVVRRQPVAARTVSHARLRRAGEAAGRRRRSVLAARGARRGSPPCGDGGDGDSDRRRLLFHSIP